MSCKACREAEAIYHNTGDGWYFCDYHQKIQWKKTCDNFKEVITQDFIDEMKREIKDARIQREKSKNNTSGDDS